MRTLLALSLILASSLSSAQSKSPSDVAHYISNGDYLDLKISPDGEHLAALVRSDDAVALLFVTSASFQVVGGVKAIDGDTIVDFRWANKERVLYEVAVKEGRLVNPVSTGELYAVNIDGGGQKRVFGFRVGSKRKGRLQEREASWSSHRILSLLPDDPKHILIEESPWELIVNRYYDTGNTYPIVTRLNIYSGSKRKQEVLPHRGASALADAEGNVRFMQWTDKDAQLHAAFRDTVEGEWISLDGDLESYSNPFLVSLNREANVAYLIANQGEGLHDAVIAYDFASGAVSHLAGPLEADIHDVLFDPASRELLAVTSMPAGPRYDYIDGNHALSKLHRGLRESFPEQLVEVVSVDDSGNNLVIRVVSDRNPGEYYLFNTERREARFVFANRTWMDINSLPRTATETVIARDGIDIPILLTVPTSSADTPIPLIVLIHGGPHGVRSQWTFDEEVQLFAGQGYAVLQVNFRGSGGYGLTFEKAGYGEWGGKIIEDIIDALDWLDGESGYEFGDTCAYGASFGAYASMMLAARIPERIACVGAYAGVYDLPTMFESGDITQLRWGQSYLEDALGLDAEHLSDFSPTHHASAIIAPVLLVHGDEDRRAPIEHAELMLAALRKAGGDVQYQVLKGGGHGTYLESKRIERYENLLAFFDQHLK